MSDRLQRLKEILGEISDVNRAGAVLAWDQETYMPPGGLQNRADQLTTLRRLAHIRFTADEVGALLDDAESEVDGQPVDSDEASLVRVTRRDYDLARKLPAELVAEIARSSSAARPFWQQARPPRLSARSRYSAISAGISTTASPITTLSRSEW